MLLSSRRQRSEQGAVSIEIASWKSASPLSVICAPKVSHGSNFARANAQAIHTLFEAKSSVTNAGMRSSAKANAAAPRSAMRLPVRTSISIAVSGRALAIAIASLSVSEFDRKCRCLTFLTLEARKSRSRSWGVLLALAMQIHDKSRVLSSTSVGSSKASSRGSSGSADVVLG